jgi:hypothetical protein
VPPNIAAAGQHRGNPVELNIGGIGDPDFPLDHRNPVQLLAARFIGDLEVSEAFDEKIKARVDAPPTVATAFIARRRCARMAPTKW